MPKTLLERCRVDCISEFRTAARQRFDDALALSAAGRRTGAIYLWGYTAEMILKAAYFSFLGLTETDPISWNKDLKAAIDRGRSMFRIAWPREGAGHNVRAWAELLVAERASTAPAAYAGSWGRDVQKQGQRIYEVWRETLRYHKNFACLYEMRQARQAAEWFWVNSDAL